MGSRALPAPTLYSWAIDKRKATLLKDGKEQLVLEQEKRGQSTFTYRNARYTVKNEGFWDTRTSIEANGEQVLRSKRHFLGSKATIEFADATQYHCKLRNAPLVKLIFGNTQGEPILSYRLDATLRPRTVLEVYSEELQGDHLVLLLVLGFHAFKGVIKENDDPDLLLMVA